MKVADWREEGKPCPVRGLTPHGEAVVAKLRADREERLANAGLAEESIEERQRKNREAVLKVMERDNKKNERKSAKLEASKEELDMLDDEVVVEDGDIIEGEGEENKKMSNADKAAALHEQMANRELM